MPRCLSYVLTMGFLLSMRVTFLICVRVLRSVVLRELSMSPKQRQAGVFCWASANSYFCVETETYLDHCYMSCLQPHKPCWAQISVLIIGICQNLSHIILDPSESVTVQIVIIVVA